MLHGGTDVLYNNAPQRVCCEDERQMFLHAKLISDAMESRRIAIHTAPNSSLAAASLTTRSWAVVKMFLFALRVRTLAILAS
jgi:hypothetical protein